MFCPKCGTLLPDGTKFCSSCGTALMAAAQPVSGGMPEPEVQPAASQSPASMPMMAPMSGSSSAPTSQPAIEAPASAAPAAASGAAAAFEPPASAQVASGTPQEPSGGFQSGGFVPPPADPASGAVPPAQPGGKKSPAPIIIAAVVALIVIIGLIAFLVRGCGGAGHSRTEATLVNPPAMVTMFTDGDGRAAAVYADGTYATVDADVSEGYASAYGEAIAFEDEDGGLHVADGDGGDIEMVFDNVDDIRSVSGTSVVYEDWNDYTLYAYMISSGETIDLGEYDSSIDEYKFAQTTSSVAFVDKSGRMIVWADGASSSESVASVSGTVEILGVSDSGNIVIWSEIESGDETLMAYENGEVVNLGKYSTGATGSYGNFYAFANADESAYIIDSFYYDSIIYKEVGEEETVIGVGADLRSVTVSSQEGPFARINGGIDEGYVLTDDALTYVDFDSGESTLIASSVSSYSVRSGTLAYIRGGELYVMDANGKADSDPACIGSAVGDMQVSDNGRYVYYTTDDDELYMWELGDREATLVSTRAINDLTGSFVITEGGETVYYVEGGSALYSYTYGDDSGTEVMSGLASAYLLEGTEYIGDNDSFYFYADSDTVYVCNAGVVEEVLSGVDDFM